MLVSAIDSACFGTICNAAEHDVISRARSLRQAWYDDLKNTKLDETTATSHLTASPPNNDVKESEKVRRPLRVGAVAAAAVLQSRRQSCASVFYLRACWLPAMLPTTPAKHINVTATPLFT